MFLTDRQQRLDSLYEHDAEVQPPRSRAAARTDPRRANARFAERAYDEVSVEDIASAAGVTRGLVHHYFGGRKEVYIALLERIGTTREEQLPPPVGRSARARLADSVSRWLDWTEQNRTGLARHARPRRRHRRPRRQGRRPRPRGPSRRPSSPPTTPTSPTTHHGCVTPSNAGPGSTAPPPAAGYKATPPAKQTQELIASTLEYVLRTFGTPPEPNRRTSPP